MRDNSPTLKRFRQTYVPPTPEVEAIGLWLPSDCEDETTLTPKGAAIAGRLDAAIEARRWPDHRPIFYPELSDWPAPLGDAAYHGFIGDLVQEAAAWTEAAQEAMLVDFLTSFGVLVGRGPHFRLGGSIQQPRLFTIIVGDTARGRKGASRDVVHTLTKEADYKTHGTDLNLAPGWTRAHYLKGLTSGEGLIAAVERNHGDGRMLIVEGELARLITAAAREGSTLSPLIRDAYDTNSLRVANKNSPIETNDAYIGIVANITQGELMGILNSKGAVEAINGFGNRFLYVASRRSHKIPSTALPRRLAARSTTMVRDAVKRARRIDEMHRNDAAEKLWREWYYELPEPEGTYGAMTARLDVHAIRLSMLYALADGMKTINAKHVEAAFEVIRYADESARYIIGDSTGNPIADKLLRALRVPDFSDPNNPRPRTDLTRAEQFALFNGHITKDELDRAVAMLIKSGLAEQAAIPTGGRPKSVLRASEVSA